jgi:hypothetical protein
MDIITMLLSGRSPSSHVQVNPGSILCYLAGARRLPSPQSKEAQGPTSTPPTRVPPLPCQRAGTELHHWVVICHTVVARRPGSLRRKKAQHFPLCLTTGEPCFSIKEWEYHILHWGEESFNLLLSGQHHKACIPKELRDWAFANALAGESNLSCARAGIQGPRMSGIPLLCTCQKACLPRCTEAQCSPLYLTMGEPSFPIKKWECQIPHWGMESCNLLLSGWHQKACIPKGVQRPSTVHHAYLQESPISPL